MEPAQIPGYNLFFLTSLALIAAAFLMRKSLKSRIVQN
ncbi:MAG: Loki-CTERM sorting domain-containing protein [Promethearchaeia archaeon]